MAKLEYWSNEQSQDNKSLIRKQYIWSPYIQQLTFHWHKHVLISRQRYCKNIFIRWTFNFLCLVGRTIHKFNSAMKYVFTPSWNPPIQVYTNMIVIKTTKLNAIKIKWFYSIQVGNLRSLLSKHIHPLKKLNLKEVTDWLLGLCKVKLGWMTFVAITYFNNKKRQCSRLTYRLRCQRTEFAGWPADRWWPGRGRCDSCSHWTRWCHTNPRRRTPSPPPLPHALLPPAAETCRKIKR